MAIFIKKQSPFVITIGILAVMALVMLIPKEAVLSKVIKDDFTLEYVDLGLKMGVLFLIGLSLIRVLKIHTVAGVSKQLAWKSKYLNLVPVYLFTLGILSISAQDISLIEPANLLLLLFACLLVGFAEEFLFRGLLLPLFLHKYGTRKHGVFLSILLTSLFFGVFHLINLTKNNGLGEVLIQVVFATFIGFFFGALLLKTNRLIPIAITHGLINFFFSLAFLPGLKAVPEELTDTVSLAPIVLFFPLLVIGLLIYKKLDKKEIIDKLEMSMLF